MKKLKVAIASLIIMPLIIMVSHVYLNKTSQRLAEKLDAVEKSAAAQNVKQSQKQLDDFMGDWEKNKPIIATFIRHAELDIANQSASKLKAYLDNKDESDFFGECDALKMQVHHIAETEKFSMENIL